MKTTFLTIRFSVILLLVSFVVGCKKEQQGIPFCNVEEDQTEIARIEKETGQPLFKRDIVYQSGGNKAVLRLATKNESFFKRIVENYDVSILPVHKHDKFFNSKSKSGKQLNDEHILAEKMIVEFVSTEPAKGVVGFRTAFQLKKPRGVQGNASSSSEWHYVEVVSGNWPDQLFLSGDIQTIKFHCKRKWYNGWESDTNCILSSSESGDMAAGKCNSFFSVADSTIGSIYFNVDGPWRSRFRILTYGESYNYVYWTTN